MIQAYYDKEHFNIEIKDNIAPYFPDRPITIKYQLYTLDIYHWDTDVINQVLKEINAPFGVNDDNKTTN